MSRIVSPKQLRVNDPYQQRLLQFDTTDSRVYLSRAMNHLLKSVGNDAVVKGFDVTNITVINNIATFTISPGLLIQDTTLIEVSESFTLDLDISGLDSCNGYLIIYTNYQYLYSIEENHIRFKLSYITKDGMLMSPLSDPWDKNKNKIFLNLYRFDTEYNIIEILNPDFFFISGKIHYRRGRLNFEPLGVKYPDPFYFALPHGQNSYKIFSQLFDENSFQRTINTMYLENETIARISIDEYKDFENYFQIFFASAEDCDLFTVSSSQFTNGVYTLVHNYNKKYVMVQVYNENYELVHPRYITLTDVNSLKIDFSNILSDLAANYHIIVLKNNIAEFEIDETVFDYEQVLIEHNLNRSVLMSQIVNNTTNLLYERNEAFQLYNKNNILFNTSLCDFVRDQYTVLLYKNINYIYNLYSDNTYTKQFSYYLRKFNKTELVNNEIQINHKLNDSYPLVQALDQNLNLIFLNNIQSIDHNIIKITFDQTTIDTLSTSEYFNIIIYSYKQELINIDTPTQLINIDLDQIFVNDTENPIIQLYDNNKQVIIPQNIIRNTPTNYSIEFNNNFIPEDLHITLTQGYSSYTETISTTNQVANTITVNHNLNTLHPIAQIYNDNKLFYPNQITVIDQNSILFDFGFPIILSNIFINIISGIQKVPLLRRTDNYYIKEFNQTDLVNSKLTVTHNLNFDYPIIQIYSDYDELIIPGKIKILSSNEIQISFNSELEQTVNFIPNSILESFYKVVIIKP